MLQPKSSLTVIHRCFICISLGGTFHTILSAVNEELLFWPQTCQPLIKENLETLEKKSGDSIKNSEILFFSRSRLNKPLFHRGKSLTVYLNVLFVFPGTTGKLNMGDAWELDLVPRAYSPFKMADRHEEKRLSLLNTSENHSWVQKSKNSVLLY